MMRKNAAALGWIAGIILLFVLMEGFLIRSIRLGIWGLTEDLTARSPFYSNDLPVVTFIIYLHMVIGALLLLLAPFQLLKFVRTRFPSYHRWAGRIMVAFGLFAAWAGIHYSIAHGTTGGSYMDFSSSLYGVLFLAAAVRTYQTARARRWLDHRKWALRSVVLAYASWLYRVHYVIWDKMTGGLWVTADMRGPFDIFQAFMFYLGYLAYLEAYFMWETRRRKAKARQMSEVFVPASRLAVTTVGKAP